jgi:hypothetical protein
MVITSLAYFHDSVTPSTETRASLDAVRLATQALPDNNPNILMGAVLYDTPGIPNAAGGDGQHVKSDADSAKEITRFIHMLRFLFYGGTEGRGPRLASLTRVDATHVDVVFAFSGTAALMGGEPPLTGWRIIESGAPLTVTAANRISGSTVRLTVSGGAVVSNSTLVSWASYNDAVNSILTDNTADAMPAEPFANVLVP